MAFISVSHTNAIMRIKAAGHISDISVTLCAARVTHHGEIQLAGRTLPDELACGLGPT